LVKKNSFFRSVAKVALRLLRIPIALRGWVRGLKTLSGRHLLIVPGTGLLTDAFDRPFGWPYLIFKWSLIGKLCGCRLLFVSVGAGPIYHPVSRWFIKSALSMADFRSYREESSAAYLNSVGFSTQRDRIFPDLAFSLPTTVSPPVHNHEKRRPIVGIGLMEYAGRLSVDKPQHSTYVAYLNSLVPFIEWLLMRGYDVSLLLGDASDDAHVVAELKELLKRHAWFDQSRIIDAPILTVEDLLIRLEQTEAVVATRFHNALLSLVLDKPVIMISFHHKCTSLMKDMGLSHYCEDIHSLSAARLVERFLQLEENAQALKDVIKTKADLQRQALEKQYEIIAGEYCSVAGAGLEGELSTSRAL